ncbi:hypothetical protein CAOG_07903 [Capsaspora owczarzaki ATCC 30864]|uniref:PIG-P domain-containing protein n=1 Tax=Capsaspora owczarzaki (strain ATCC 30864) TaxID=595528 RepID=A0A0D2X5H3_CAPO3|nr:hypothetical protein CAOG_07903 [Capsaspora owczarzaki ATCC 30864]KJE97809.1 hypothetical protein CAOG_007903 [Capsaspora owczarzaki ATCC 30864]|eukprot:XP_004342988.1 hypothetical protein CAOG_07903 [Capsaspora owczarzaki ATCC 30864]
MATRRSARLLPGPPPQTPALSATALSPSSQGEVAPTRLDDRAGPSSRRSANSISISKPATLVVKDPNAPSREIYGFVFYLAAWAAWVAYILWAVVPDEYLRMVGITYFPQKYWAVAVPAYACMIWVFIYWFYLASNLLRVPALDSTATILDSHTVTRPAAAILAEIEHPQAIPALADIPVSTVHRVMFPDEDDDNKDDD